MYDIINRDDIQIYGFFPHGSKKPEHLLPLQETEPPKYETSGKKIIVICHDQEPLDFDLYSSCRPMATKFEEQGWSEAIELYSKLSKGIKNAIPFAGVNSHDACIITHSEKNSQELLKYQNHGYVGVYWWSHAVIAQDWFRFAKHDFTLTVPRTPSVDFLIYNRAWTGTREYRIKFAEMLVNAKLEKHCQTNFNASDQSNHWLSHCFVNDKLRPQRQDLDQLLQPTPVDSSASADYVAKDYCNTRIEIVLETLFDDCRNHLTEKSLRPIACQQPFMLAAAAGSLAYLRSYGFKTFAPYIDETYDTVQDPILRLHAIIKEMQRIAGLSTYEKKQLSLSMQPIVAHNHQRFFSQEFLENVISEYKNNMSQAVSVLKQNQNSTVANTLRRLIEQIYK